MQEYVEERTIAISVKAAKLSGISEKDGLYNTYHEQKQRFRELQTVKRNIDQILRREEPHRRKEQSHER